MSDPARIARMIQDEQPTTRCDLTDLPPAYCACPAHRNIQEERKSPQKRATFRGTCRCCLVNPIQPGSLIEPYENGWKLVDCDA